jgi:hypothetical protein
VANGGKYIGAVSSGTFNAVAVVDAPLSGFMIDIKVGEIVVKVDGARAKVAAEQSGVRREDSGDVDTTLSTKRDSKPGKPLMEMGDNGFRCLAEGELGKERRF